MIEEGYNSGLDAFLSGNVDAKDLSDITKSIFYYPLYLVPGVLPYREAKKPKEERHTGKAIISTVGLITAGAILKLGIVYAGKVASTGNWHPFKFDSKEKKEQIDATTEKKSSNLEKNVYYEDILNNKNNN